MNLLRVERASRALVSASRGNDLLWGAQAPSRVVFGALPEALPSFHFRPDFRNKAFGEAPKLAREARALP